MKHIQSTIILSLILAVLVIAAGCSDDDKGMMSDNTAGSLIAVVYPVDGATAVNRSSSIAVKFSEPVDTSSVMGNFHLAGGDDMHTWMDSVAHNGGLGHMSGGAMNHMMNWMDSISMAGVFHWNDVMDSCEFIPDSDMMANQEHMILMCEGEMMGSGGMMGGGSHGDNEYHTYHFETSP